MPWHLLGAAILLCLAPRVSALDLQLRIDDLVAPKFSLQGIRARVALSPPGLLDIRIAQVSLQDRHWQDVSLRCPRPQISRGLIACPRGMLQGDQSIPLSFRYWPTQRRLQLQLQPEAQEQWGVDLRWHAGQVNADLKVTQGQAMRLNEWLPTQFLQMGQGTFDLDGKLQWQRAGGSHFDADMTLYQASFSNAAGTRAGEKLEAHLHLTGQQRATWEWQGDLQWASGEVFWQPLYFPSGPRRLIAHGEFSPAGISIRDGELHWAGIGAAVLNASWDRASRKFLNWDVAGKGLALDNLYPVFIKPFLPAGVLQKIQLQGLADGDIAFRQGKMQALNWKLQQTSIVHDEQKFAFEGVDGVLAWDRATVRANHLKVAKGRYEKLDVGAFQLQADIAPDHVTVPPLSLPILDGMLNVEQIDAKRVDGNWQWTMSAALQPVSMERLSRALQWPTMQGTLSAIIPEVHYEHRGLRVEGALLFRVFDGTVVVRDLSASDLLSPTPHVQADIDMRNLDLALLTNTFSFGSIQGRLDVNVDDLELFAWKPVRMDANVRSSPVGDYPRKISQRAVQNITALGGGGGAAALQRSFLSFFDQFGYKQIGISCRLANGVCEMGGVRDAPTGFVLVEGGGIPALTVIGYNRQVDWNELLARLQRVTKGSKPVVQ